MSTRQTPAMIRAFNYAIESIHDPEGQAAFRRDHARALVQGVCQFEIIQMCQSAALTMAMTEALEAASRAGDEAEALALYAIVMMRTAPSRAG